MSAPQQPTRYDLGSGRYVVEWHRVYTYHQGEGVHHRDNGPAYVYPDGVITYRKYGKSHREDGPYTYLPVKESCYYCVHGNFLSEEVFLKQQFHQET